jgi:regulator of protease activity HflC (stomatin/prohibitin superfamily)
VTVPSGYVGVLWKRFRGGTVLDPRQLKREGLRFIWPWDQVFLYDTRVQSATETYNAISRDGISLTASINFRYRLKSEAIPKLHQVVGPNYVASLVIPEIGNRMREVIAQYAAEDVYSTKRQEIQTNIRKRVDAMLGESMMEHPEGEDYTQYRVPLNDMLNLIDTLILGIELPTAVATAINRKIEQYYISEEYKFRVAREVRESERKKIEAEGIHDFQQIVSRGISDSYLRWRGIEATLQLAQSPNAKVVIVGSGKDGLPIILGNVDSASPPSTGTENGAAKEKITLITPATSSEKAPSGTTTATPAEKLSSTGAVEAQHYKYPLPSLSEIEASFSRWFGTQRPAGGEPLPADSSVATKSSKEQAR